MRFIAPLANRLNAPGMHSHWAHRSERGAV